MTSRFVEAHIEVPYDRGYPWHLIVGNVKAVISERAAFVLAGRFGVSIKNELTLPGKLTDAAKSIGEDFHLSKKARAILARVGIAPGGS
jgi:hypothetical protein